MSHMQVVLDPKQLERFHIGVDWSTEKPTTATMVTVDGGKTWSPYIKRVCDAELRKLNHQPSRFRELWRLYHEKRKPHTINQFKELPWTIAWECKQSPTGWLFIGEIWMGGPMSWTYHLRPDSLYRYHSKESAAEDAVKVLWEEKNPNCHDYKIVNIREI